MKYYIVGKKIKEGNLESDSENGLLNEYFELGWEYLVSHLYIKHLFSTKVLQEDDIIVTLEDRMFLYQGFWKNVMSYEDFSKKNSDDTENLVVDLCELIHNNQVEYIPKLNSDKKYLHWETDKDIIKNIKYKNIEHLNTDKPFCCLHIRYRKWASSRNISKEFWQKIIEKIKLSGLNIFIFGKEAKDFSDNKNIFHVNLDEYASLLNNKNCQYIIGNMSGGTLVAQTFCHENCKQYVIINDQQTFTDYRLKNLYSAFYHIEEFNFSGAPISYIMLDKFAEADDIKIVLENEYNFETLINEI